MQFFLISLENKKVTNKNAFILSFKYIHLLVLHMLHLLVFCFFVLLSTYLKGHGLNLVSLGKLSRTQNDQVPCSRSKPENNADTTRIEVSLLLIWHSYRYQIMPCLI